MISKFSFLLFFLSISLTLQRDFDSSFAFEMLRTSSAAYCNAKDLHEMDCGTVCDDLPNYRFLHQYTINISLYESVSYSMFVNHDKQRFVTAFRGTQGRTQLLQEFLHSGAVTYDLHPINNAMATKYFFHKYKEFLRQSFLAHLEAATQTHPDFEFYMVGHSLGGAFASLAVIDIKHTELIDKERVHLYTYGSPRVGDINLVREIINSVNENYRVTHKRDIVPHLPPCIPNLQGGCSAWETHGSQDGYPIYSAYHVWPEVFYNGSGPNGFVVCESPEDAKCSNQYSLFFGSIDDHRNYLGVSTRCLGKGVV